MAQEGAILECAAELKVKDFAAACSSAQTRPWGAPMNYRQIASSGIMSAAEHFFALVVVWAVTKEGEVDKDSHIGVAVKLLPASEDASPVTVQVWLTKLSIVNQASNLTATKSDNSFEPLESNDLRGWADFFPKPGHFNNLSIGAVLDCSKRWLHDGELHLSCEMYVKPVQAPLPKAGLFVPKQDFGHFWASKDFADVVIAARDDECYSGYSEFKAHRIVLAARCPVFERMLLQPMVESNQQRIVLCDLPAALVGELLFFLYTGNLHAEALQNDDLVFQLLEAADRFDLPDLLQCCSEVLGNRPAVDNVCDWLCSITHLGSLVRLQVQLIAFIHRNMQKVRTTAGFERLLHLQPAFLELDTTVPLAVSTQPEQVTCQTREAQFATAEVDAIVQETAELAGMKASYDFSVSGAGGKGSGVNGNYVAVDMFKSKPKFKLVGGEAIMYFHEYWKLNDKDDVRGWYYAVAGSRQVEPPTGAWTLHGYGGTDTAPPPVVARGPAADLLCRHCRLVLKAPLLLHCLPVPDGGLQEGHLAIYLGSPREYRSGDALKRRHPGRVVGDANGDSVRVQFQGHGRTTILEKEQLGWQPLPAGLTVGARVRYSGLEQQFPSGDCLKAGHIGEVTGPSSDFNMELIEVKFQEHQEKSNIEHNALTRLHAVTAGRRKRPREGDETANCSISSKRQCPHRRSQENDGSGSE